MKIEQLVRKAQKKDHDAFYELISIHKFQLYKIAFSYFKNEQDALEAVQEVTCRAFIKIKKLKSPQYFSTWLIRILLNYCNDELKRKKRAEVKEIEISFEQNETEILTKVDLEKMVNLLDPKYQEVIKLKYVHDLTIPQIAAVVESPEGTVKTWLNKSLKLLRKQMKREGGSFDA
ncbi:sigma-70 family RNA polymerase sigma factor [Chengkuizengella axinellae]|uniref:Sigma-70 family RNA polymerase sigma factor n=1 Tax=Chengkuizengella axinellae TaxID=3064388 RepID=A0ABT9J1U0_9BACL|nr:sigma-70 family RNA polymerase sigma factor [Chengkuizengella sp. 2205SS18-9]MDP5275576.1 sigma-70 family RNA polymerase sigma factor [Chengkuizengella sp. 2205SS18-9]